MGLSTAVRLDGKSCFENEPQWKLEGLPRGQGAPPDTAYQDLKKRLQGMYKDEIKDLEATQNRYDKETAHGTRKEIQAQWRQRLDRALQMLPAQKS